MGTVWLAFFYVLHCLFHTITLGAHCEEEETDTEKLNNLLRVTE